MYTINVNNVIADCIKPRVNTTRQAACTICYFFSQGNNVKTRETSSTMSNTDVATLWSSGGLFAALNVSIIKMELVNRIVVLFCCLAALKSKVLHTYLRIKMWRGVVFSPRFYRFITRT